MGIGPSRARCGRPKGPRGYHRSAACRVAATKSSQVRKCRLERPTMNASAATTARMPNAPSFFTHPDVFYLRRKTATFPSRTVHTDEYHLQVAMSRGVSGRGNTVTGNRASRPLWTVTQSATGAEIRLRRVHGSCKPIAGMQSRPGQAQPGGYSSGAVAALPARWSR